MCGFRRSLGFCLRGGILRGLLFGGNDDLESPLLMRWDRRDQNGNEE